MTVLENPRGHVVFDCDGTLISSFESILEGVAECMTIVLGRSVSVDEARDKYEPDLLALARKFDLDPEGDLAVREKLLNTWRKVATKHHPRMQIFKGIRELLQELTRLNYQLYVWTARDRQSTLRILKEQEVAQFFLDFSCVDDTTPKPSPQGIIEMVGDVSKDKVVVIGDSYTDLKGAKSFGCQSIAALWCPHVTAENLAEYGPTSLANSPQDCLKEIEKLIG